MKNLNSYKAQGFIERWFRNQLSAPKIPKELMAMDCLLESNHLGFSLLHIAARMGQLGEVPKELLTQKYLMLADAHGKTVMGCCAEGGFINTIPKELLTESNLCAYGDPPVIHTLATRGELNKIPEDFLNQKVLLTLDKHKNTALHNAAEHDQIKQIPIKLLTDENLMETNKHGESVLDLMYRNVDPENIPNKYTTESCLLHLGVTKRHLSKIIEQCYTKKDFTILERCISNFSEAGLNTIMYDYTMDPHDVAKKVLYIRKAKKKIKGEIARDESIEV
jgi:hypothetical protein